MDLRTKFHQIEQEVNKIVLEQRDAVHGITLALLSNANALFLGPPGVAKSYSIRQYCRRITGGRYFEYLLGQYSLPEELFGPFDIMAIQKGEFVRKTTGRLPEAHVAFIDEIFKGNSGIINSLLGAMNERHFDNNGKLEKIPLLSLIGASNELPEDGDGLGAALDRFSLKFYIEPVADPENFKLMLSTHQRELETTVSPITIEDILAARKEIEKIKVSEAMEDIQAELRDQLEKAGIRPSPRVWVYAQQLIKAQAWYNGRKEVTKGDMAVLKDSLWTNPTDIKVVRTKVLLLTIPEEQQGLDEYDKAQEIYSEFLNDLHAAKGDQAKIMAACHTTAGKLKTINMRLAEIHAAYKKSNGDMENAHILGFAQKITGLIKQVHKHYNP